MQKTVAVIGASADRNKFGNKAVRAFVTQGFTVYPVNPKGGTIEGLPAYVSIAEVPAGRLQRISVYLPPAVAIGELDAIAQRGCDELWLNPGSDAPEVIDRARALGIEPIVACSIVGVGVSPEEL